jgi:hypothetical protein
MLRFLLGIAVGWAAASAIQGTHRRPDRSRTAEGRVDELSAAQDDPTFGIGQLNAGDGTPSDIRSAPTAPSARYGVGGGDPAALARTEASGAQTSDSFNGA